MYNFFQHLYQQHALFDLATFDDCNVSNTFVFSILVLF